MRQRLRRSESTFGIHFDFHAQDNDTPVGRNTTPDAISRMLDTVQPDYIQFDCKGHPGLSSYPTRVGNPAPVIIGDPLRVVRDVTAERGVALYMHYSGLWDTYAISKNPSWAVIDADGETDPDITSVFGPYVDELMIPQLKELSRDYGVDGVWVDGDTWAAKLDYSPAAVRAFNDATGLTAPRTSAEPGWDEFRDFSREAYRSYLRHYVDALHEFDPSLQIAANWAFTEFMPEPVSAGVDFLSGDANSRHGFNQRNEARCMANQGAAWDIMSWSFAGDWPDPGTNTTKTAVQLQQEAATVISLGGGYQAVFNQMKDGTVIQWNLGVMAEVGRFCREREELCHDAERISDVALLYSGTDMYRRMRENPSLFNPGNSLDSLRGSLDVLLDGQFTVDIVIEEILVGSLDRFSVVVVPGCASLGAGVADALLEHVAGGGHLVVCGAGAGRIFADRVGVELGAEAAADAAFFLEHDGHLTGHRGSRIGFGELPVGAKPFGGLYPVNNTLIAAEPASIVVAHGAGQIAFVAFDLGAHYYVAESSVARHFLAGVIGLLGTPRTVEVSGTGLVDVVLTRRADQLVVHLVNTAGRQKDNRVWVTDEIPPVGPVHVRLASAVRPATVTVQPRQLQLEHTYADGFVEFDVPRVEIHEIVVVDLTPTNE